MAITLSRLLPVHNGFIKIPRGEIALAGRVRVKDVLDAVPGAKVVQVGPTGRRYVSMDSVSGGTDTLSWGLFDYPRHDFFVELPAVDVRSHTSPDDDFETVYDLA
jgi:hypothetical protein